MLQRIKNKLIRALSPASDTVKVSADFFKRDIKFKCESNVERFRTIEFGGEKEFLKEFVQSLSSTDIVWDVGSNIGLFGISAAITAINGAVVSFDPDPQIIERLSENVKLNGLENYQSLQLALSDSDGTLELFTTGVHGFSPSLKLQTREGAPTNSIQVRCSCGDQLIRQGTAPSPTIMKIDVEGAEFQVLSGLKDTLASPTKPRLVFIELHPNFLPGFGRTVSDCEVFLETCGYRRRFRWERDAEIQCLFEAK